MRLLKPFKKTNIKFLFVALIFVYLIFANFLIDNTVNEVSGIAGLIPLIFASYHWKTKGALLSSLGIVLSNNTLFALKGVQGDLVSNPLTFRLIGFFSLLLVGITIAKIKALQEAAASSLAKSKELQEQLALMVEYDSLTGIYSRRGFLNHLEDAIQRTQRNANSNFSLLFLDIDSLKPVNDTFGHAAGDQALIETGTRLKDCVRKIDKVGRMGGDEFCILIEGTNKKAYMEKISKRILNVFRTPLTTIDAQPVVGISIGIVINGRVYEDPYDAIRDADIAMYQAKTNGGNSYAFFSLEALATEALKI